MKDVQGTGLGKLDNTDVSKDVVVEPYEVLP